MIPHHGICLPLSSIYTKNSCGIGEILDLLPLIDWVKSVGMNTLQLLPLNDTGNDSSPYNAVSSCALNPVYLSIHALPFLNESPQLTNMLGAGRSYPPYVDYQKVREQKEFWLKTYLDQFMGRLMQDINYQFFVEQNRWLSSYGTFICLVRANGYKHWTHWEIHEVDPFLVEREKIIQFLLHQQLKSVKRYASEKGVDLMGDIPILVSSQSADVWKHPDFFNLSSTVGAPPDQFSSEGQAWGFPYFKWDESWRLWKRKLSVAENYYHLYRLDHIVGFFRLWKIPEGKIAKEGSYVPANEEEATARGKRILEEIKTYSSMQPIGEDLGVVLPAFREVLKQLSIPGMKVMRWERYWNWNGQFIPVEQYEPLSLTCVSTHDTETVEEWWNGHPEESGLYCRLKNIPYRPFDQTLRLLYLRDSHHSGSLYHVNLFNEYLALYPELVHDSGYEERINRPGTPPQENWRYRLRLPLEKTLSHDGLKASIRSLLT